MIQEFKDFVNRGNVMELAVAVVIGAAFGVVINSFVNDILMQLIAAIFGQPDFSGLSLHWGDKIGVAENGADLYESQIFYGNFLNAVISFLAIAFGVFLVVKVYNRYQSAKEEEAAGPSEIDLLTEIRDALKK
ncbi:MAG: large conductance mechanosensitive channel protein MscL [Acidimicrobiales bacterium]|nr:large conductance mechanosensitive channel protein MscL [Acidimicrobiales bacterium]